MTAVVNGITQKNVPVAEIDKPIKIDFIFDTNGEPETVNARIEAMVISDGIITAMYSPVGSEFKQSSDKKRASVVSIADKSNGWGRNRHVTLEFDSLPKGAGEYIVGTLYYYNADDIIGLGIPLVVNLSDERVI